MKNMKKIVAMALAVVMILSLATTVFAEDNGYTLTLNGAQADHTYTAYQIFKGDLHENTLSNIEWGAGVTTEGQNKLGNAAAKAGTLTSTDAAQDFAAAVAPYLAEAAGSVTISAEASTGSITGLKAGYYLVKTTGLTTTNSVHTYYIMEVVKDTEATIKADYPEVEKKIKLKDGTLVDYTNASIGDTVTFVLTATMPTTLEGYDHYKIIFHDTLSDGLAYKDIVSVTVAGVDKTSAFTSTHENGTLTISCNDVKAQGATVGSKIIVTYEAILDTDAEIGDEGNPNEVYLEYSNNPNWDESWGTDEKDNDGDGKIDEEDNDEKNEPTGETPPDEVIVYTWEIPVFKYTMNNNAETALAGAVFTLYTDSECTIPVNVVATDDAAIYKVCTLNDSKDGHTHLTQITTGETGRFEIEGLAAGKYYLKEETAPNGYNTADVVTVEIDENGLLNAKVVDDETESETEIKVLNQKGSTLPSTGGIGTTLFYVFGGVLVLAAVVLLITKKRMASAE